ncbi:transaldolase [Telmatocola sphagniphila]|uniref:Transaldolase n=1 Tax=Telmatocola sphagniphila TaxID=1123043 RepID=A0A8E6ET28_9BACT|nr:transaldolase [Telmatocola sphagniphila]QVL31849.1 transaldolase [Telmatocola sphagniphila]
MNRLKELSKLGQSVWLDYIKRSSVRNGELANIIKEDGLGGVTSNPAIFEKAFSGSTDYVEALAGLANRKDLDTKGAFEILAVEDIQGACDLLKPVYDKTACRDGYVSLEVAPTLANDTAGTLAEARRLWKMVGRPNLMIKVPATNEGIPAFKQLISEGININVTLLFDVAYYERVALAYIEGLEAHHQAGGDLKKMASVASFFVSRIDSSVDALTAKNPEAAKFFGKVAIANAKVAYQSYKKIFAGPRWSKLAAAGAQTQRVLWASTGTKSPKLKDTLYVEELIGPDTVNTIPPATFDAFRDHGVVALTLEKDVDAAYKTLQELETAGISLKKITDDLLVDGVKLFADAFVKLLAAVQKARG